MKQIKKPHANQLQPAPLPEEKMLTLNECWKAVGTERIKDICLLAGTSFLYFRMMCYHVKPCSPRMFERISKALKETEPQLMLDYYKCTSPIYRAAAKKLQEQRRLGAATQARKTASRRTRNEDQQAA